MPEKVESLSYGTEGLMLVLGFGEKIDSEDGQRIGFERGSNFFFFLVVLLGFMYYWVLEKKSDLKKKNNNANMETLKVKRKGSMCIDKPEILPVYA